MRDPASLSARVANSSVVSLRRVINGLDTIASLTLSLPPLSRLREPPSIAPSSLWALDHDPFFVVLVSEVPALPDPPPRCACRFCLDGSRGTTLAWSKVNTSSYAPPTDIEFTGEAGVSCSCRMTPILVDPHAVRWGPASTSWLLPPAMLAPADAGAALSLTASVRQLRWAFTVALLPESKTRPRAEAKWHSPGLRQRPLRARLDRRLALCPQGPYFRQGQNVPVETDASSPPATVL